MRRTSCILKTIFIILITWFSCALTQVKAIDYINQNGDSIIDWALAVDTLTNGYYKIIANGQSYPMHVYFYNGDQTWTSNMTFGDGNDIGTSSRQAVNGIVVIVKGNLTINSGVTVTAYRSDYGGPKGLFIICTGNFVNNGTVTMTARGAYSSGQAVYLYKDPQKGYTGFTVPAQGGAGGASFRVSGQGTVINGNAGKVGGDRATGGGGTGAGRNWYYSATIGRGGYGTSYSGGSGSGASNSDGGSGWHCSSGQGSDIGGPGSNGTVCSGNGSGYGQYSIGGTGNPSGGNAAYRQGVSSWVYRSGTGGLLTIFASNFTNNGSITSEGISSSMGNRTSTNGRVDPGGASGGGSVNIFYGNMIKQGTTSAAGGAAIWGSGGALGGAGGAGHVTFSQVVLEEEYLHPTLSYLKVNGKDVTPVYNPENDSYSFRLSADDYRVTIDAQVSHLDNNITAGVGLFDIPAGTYTHTISITSYIGIVKNYTIEFYRPASSYKYLRNITLDDEDLVGFQPMKFEYNLNVDATVEILNVVGVKGRPSQVVSGDGELEIKSGSSTITISVMSEDMTSTVIYTIHIYKERSTLLKTLEFDKFDLLDTNGERTNFDPHVKDYQVEIFAGTLSLNTTAIAYDTEAKVTLFGFSYIRKSINATITVSLAGFEDTVYNVKILKGDDDVDVSYEYKYTGQYQTFEAPYTAYYKIELWGAQGGNSTGNSTSTCSNGRGRAYGGGCGGFGAYTSGWLFIRKDTKMYVYIGARGADAMHYRDVSSSWNGGGSATYDHSDDEASGAGGGSSDIRLVNTSTRSTWDEFESLKSRIMVAAGGGGGSDVYAGGNGGTLSSSNVRYANGVNQSSGYRFGKGEDGVYRRSNYDVAGGGGGYFGGLSTARASNLYANWGQNGSGGSSYVSGCSGCKSVNEDATEYENLVTTSDNVHPSGYEFKNIQMLGGQTNQPTTTSGYSVGHVGNGYGKITMLNLNENNYLNVLNIYDTTKTTKLYKSYSIIENDDGTSTPIEENINLVVPTTMTSVKLNGRPDDDNASVTGNGITYTVDVGVNVFTISVLAENNEERVYTITLTRDADTNIYPENIQILGLVNSLCSQKEGLCILTNDSGEVTTWNKDTFTYDITVPSRIKQLKWNVEKAQTNQVIIGDLVTNLTSGSNSITLEVESEYCSITYTDEDFTNDPSLIDGCISHYTYNVFRDVSDDCDLSELYIDTDKIEEDDPGYGVEFDLNYTDYDVYNYYFSVPSDWTYVKHLVAIADAASDGATVDISGNDPGSFDTRGQTYIVNILVTAPDRVSTSVYKLHVYRELDSNIFITDIKPYLDSISDENLIDLNKEFNKTIFDYSITIDNDKNAIKLVSLTDVITTSASITINNSASINTTSDTETISKGGVNVSVNKYESTISNLRTGYTTVTITTTSENSEIGVYTLTIFRKYNSDSSLSSIKVNNGTKEYEIVPELSEGLFDYTIEIDPDLTSISYSGVVNVNTSSIKYLDNNNIKLGSNLKRILVTAEDGGYSIYNLYIVRPASSNNNLNSLTVLGSNNITYGVDLSEDGPYEITVPNNVSYVNISGVKISQFATTRGLGRYSLSTQVVNNIIVSVTAEDGSSKTYEINIIREKNSNAFLSNINVTNGSLNKSFIKTDTEYTITVPYTTDYIYLNYSKEVSTTSVIMKDNSDNVVLPKNKINLSTGSILYKFVTLAEDQVSTLTYEITIVKEPCTVNELSSIYVKEGSLIPSFTSSNDEYTVRIPYDIEDINFVIKKAHVSQNYSISSNDSDLVVTGDKVNGLKLGDNEILVTVTPEEGETKIYAITVVRQPEGTASNRLESLSLSHGTLTPEFNKSVLSYYAEVPYEIGSTTVSYTLEDIDASATGAGTYLLPVGEEKLVTVIVTATDGYTRDYQITILRRKSSDATLSNISVNKANLSPSFNSSITEYDLSTSNTNLVFDSIITSNQYATYEINGNDEDTFLVNGDTYDVTITVTAQDGVTQKVYTIHVTKVPSKNYNLASLGVEGFTISPTFSPNISSYELTVPNDVTNVLVEATPQDMKATVEGTGVVDLDKGINYRYVKVTSESGDVKSYVLKITRELSSNNNIDSLVLNNGTFVDTNGDEISFDSNVINYNVLIDATYDSLDLEVLLEDENASYVINGNDLTNKETGVVTIIVTAENGTTKTYSLSVTKRNVPSSLLSDLYDRKYGINPVFNRYVNNYNLVVDYEYESLDLYTKTIDKEATVDILNNNLIVGNNVVQVKVTSSGDEPTINYYNINVTRNPEIDNFLDYLYTDYESGDFNETFDKRVINYTLDVSSDTESIILYGEPYTSKANVSTVYNGVTNQVIFDSNNTNVIGNFDLVKGTNTILIKVSLENVVRTYKVIITRAYDSDAYLTELIVSHESTKYQLTPEFDQNVFNYTLDVGVDIYNLTLNGTISENATVTGLDDVFLKGGANVITIKVTAEDKVTSNVYTLTINKTKSNNPYLVDLIPSDGEFEPSFTYDNNIYSMNVDSSVSTMSFDYITEDMNASVTGNDLQVVPDGTSVRTITVTAEDGTTTRAYTITINKFISSDAYLKNLSFKGYDFTDEETNITKVTFDKDVFEYFVLVNNDKITASISDFTYELNDSNSTATYSGIIKLVTTNYVQFKFNVVAEDGFTENTYVVNVMRKKSNNSLLASLVVNAGYLTTGFSPNVFSYDWYVPLYASYLNDSSVSIDLADKNATFVKSDPFESKTSKNGEMSYLITITSEDGTSTSVYSLNIYIDASSDTTLKEVSINDGYLEGELNSDDLEYVVHVYENATKVKITGITNSEYATITSSMESFLLDTDSEYTLKEIEVLAEDGETSSTYKFKVYRDVSISTTLKDLTLDGLSELDTCTSKICTLSPVFSENILEYKFVVPYEYEVLDVKYLLNSEQQSVKLRIDTEEIENKKYNLPTGESDLYVTVFDGMGREGKTYKVVVKRNLSSNAHLSSLSLSSEADGNLTLSPSFNRDTFEYRTRASVGVTSVTLNATPEESGASIRTRGLTNLAEGSNTVQITVTAPDKSTKLYYYVTVQIKPLINAYLTDITVFSSIFYDLNPTFDESIFSYTSEVASYSEYVLLEASHEVGKNVRITGTGEYTISTGVNIFNITSELLDDSDNVLATSVYTINVIRPVSDNVYLNDLKVTSSEETKLLNSNGYYDISPKFDRGTTDYRLTVSPGIKKLDVTAIPGEESFRVRVYGNNLAPNSRNIVDIIVVNEDNTLTKTYQIMVTVLPSDDSTLSSISVVDDDNTSYGIISSAFDPKVDTYSIRVPYDIDKVNVSATTTDSGARITGDGIYYLEYGNNVVTLDVLAEDEIHTSTYTVNIFREYDLYLSAINEDLEDYDINEEFLKTEVNYTMDVNNDVKAVKIEGIPEESNVTVTYNLDEGSAVDANIIDGVLYTGIGLNKVLIIVTAPDDTYKIYHLDIMRKQSDNNYLEALDFNEGNLNEPFNKEENNYTMYVLDTYTSLSYDNKKDIVTEDPNATYVVSGLSPLSKTSNNTVTVTVTSQSGKTNIYTVTVMLKPEAWFQHYLEELNLTYTSIGSEGQQLVNDATLSPTFVMNKMSYTATVPYGVSSITINTKTLSEDDEAVISASTESTTSVAFGTYALNLGRNVVNIKVHSKLLTSDGSYNIYKVIVYRSKNPDANLLSLNIANHILNPGFNTNVTNYSIGIDTSESVLDIVAVPRDPTATVTITGNGNFQQGSNTIRIRVTAADGTTHKDYTIIANCTLSDNNYLSNLEVKDYSITPEYTRTNIGVYLTNVEEDVSTVYVKAVKEDPSASVSIMFGTNTYNKSETSIKLNPGNNFVYISVTSAAGNIRTYTLNVFRSYSTDNTLKELVVSDGTLEPVFDPEVINYTVTLENDLFYLTDVSIIGIKNHPKATVRGNGEHPLKDSGTTTLEIEVTAESGDKRVYTVNFVKMEVPSSKLKLIEVNEGELSPEFMNNRYKYYVTVPYDITSLDFDSLDKIIPEDEEAEVTIINNESFKVGINIVTVQVKATNGDITKYYLYVTRSIDGNTYLKDLYIDNQVLSPLFDEDTIYYELSVASSIEKIYVNAYAQNSNATVTINGESKIRKDIDLSYGENKVYVRVVTDNGAERTYVIKVTRLLNEDNYLLTLTTNIGAWDQTFDKLVSDYVVTVPPKTTDVTLIGTASVGSTINGLGTIDIKSGDNIHTVSVTNESGLINTYTITIRRPGSNDASLKSITSDRGELTLEDGVYKITVDNDIPTIKFTVETNDIDATVEMLDVYNLEFNGNNIEIVIVAEDGTTKETINVYVYRNKHIETVNIIPEKIAININETYKTEYEYTPDNTDYTEFYWTSMNPDVATVSSDGTITGVSEGITYVYITSTVAEVVKDYLLVYVASTKITSSVYDIWHLGESENNLASVNFSYVIGINDKTNLESFLSNFDNNPDNLYVYKADDVLDGTSYVGTGMKIKLILNDIVYDELVIIVRGDNGTVEKPGNGIITSTDYATLSSILAGLTLKTPITSLLYDLNKNKILTVTDLSPMSLYIAGKATFTNLNGL